MKVIKLVSENIKGLKAVEIVPDETLQIISGKNGQGKSSVMDSIWLALGGSEATKGSNTSRAIRDGEETASIELDLGDIIVTRKWTSNDRSTLKVQSKDGSQFKSPQTMLNNLIGRLSFDPLSFSNLDSKNQIETLMNTVDLPKDPTEIDREKKILYSDRTLINREIKSLKMQIESFPEIDEDIPDEEIRSSDILSEIQNAQQIISNNNAARTQIKRVEEKISYEDLSMENEEREIESLKKQIEERSKFLAERKEKIKQMKESYNKEKEEVESLEDPNLEEFNKKLSQVESINQKVREKKKIIQLNDHLQKVSNEADELTIKIQNLENEKEEMIKNANFPIDGLTFDETEVLFNGVPLKQCSSAERLKVSMSIAMSLNPKLKVIRIMDGSLLDSNNLELIREMAGEKDYQIWVEQVDESGKVGIVIEDGEVKSINDEDTKLEIRRADGTEFIEKLSEKEAVVPKFEEEELMNLSF